MYFNFMDIMNLYKKNITLGKIANLINEGEIQNLLDIEWTVLLDNSNLWYYQGTIDVIKKIINQIVGDSVKVATIESMQKNLKRHGLHWCTKTDFQRIITFLDNLKEDINDYEYYDLQAVKRRGNNPTAPKTFQKELDNSTFKIILKRAIQAGFVEETAEGWKWIGKKKELAVFADEVSKKLKLSNKENSNGTKQISWKPFEILFNVSNLRGAYNDIQKTGALPKREKDIIQIVNG